MNAQQFLHGAAGVISPFAFVALVSVCQANPVVGGDGPFRRVATIPVFLNTNVDTQTVAEIVTATEDGNTLVYSDSANGAIGLVDITDPANPTAAGQIPVGGETTAVSVRGDFALAGVNTSVDFVNTSGDLVVVDLTTNAIARTIPLGGQPDSVAVSPDGQYAVVVIENERDEKLGNGEPPQAPAGFLVIVDLVGDDPNDWTTRAVDLTGVADLYPDDPEPEFVDINVFNVAVVTLQENNHIVLVGLASGQVLLDFPAGDVDLTDIDIDEEGEIRQTASLDGVPREPDAVAWTSAFTFATADEGDLFGGSRGFTVWSPFGTTVYEAGNTLEHATARIGHYPEERSGNKGNEPEGVEYGRYGGDRYLFVGSERSSVVFVYELTGSPFGQSDPNLVQILPTGVAPEGLLAIPSRDLFVVACEEDARDDKIRSSIMIYQRTGDGDYPSIRSVDREGTSIPIPWGALSGLVVSPSSDDTIYSVTDSFYAKSRVLEIDRSTTPAQLVREWSIVDTNDVLGNGLRRIKFQLPNTTDFDISSIVNGDDTVNLDLEGIGIDAGGFWLVSEGSGNLVGGVSDPNDRPFQTPNLLVHATPGVPTGSAGELVIDRVVGLPLELTSNQLRFGFEGVTVAEDGMVYVAFQREWSNTGDPAGHVRIGRFDPAVGMWGFAYYPLDAVTSPAGGWVGLSDITATGPNRLTVLERDNQGGPDAAVKRIYSVDITNASFNDVSAGAPGTLTKTLESDLMADGLFDAMAGLVFEKLEGMAVLSNGDTLIVNDNDGVDDNSGETRILALPGLIQ